MQSSKLQTKRSLTTSGVSCSEGSVSASSAKRFLQENTSETLLTTSERKECDETVDEDNSYELEGIESLFDDLEEGPKKQAKIPVSRKLLDIMLEKKITCYDDWTKEDNLDAYIEFSSFRNFNQDCAKFYKVVSVKQLKYRFNDFYTKKLVSNEESKIQKVLKLQFPKWNAKGANWFCNLLKMHFDSELGKRNTLCFRGVSNAGKSQLMATFTQWIVGNHYGKPSNNKNSNFPFDNCVNKRMILWEEPMITIDNIEDVKLIMGGEELRADIKFDSMMNVGKTPVIITTNNRLSKHCEPQKDALSKRMFEFYFPKALDSKWFPITGEDWQIFFDKYYQENITLAKVYEFLKTKPFQN